MSHINHKEQLQRSNTDSFTKNFLTKDMQLPHSIKQCTIISIGVTDEMRLNEATKRITQFIGIQLSEKYKFECFEVDGSKLCP